MFKILSNEQIAPYVFKMVIEAPLVAGKAKPGQFVIIRLDEVGERIPLTIANTEGNNITIVYQVVGVTTYKLKDVKKGGFLLDVVGPLGHATDVKKIGTICCIGGGVGIAELYPIVKAFRLAGNKLIVIIGARTKELLIFKKELQTIASELFEGSESSPTPHPEERSDEGSLKILQPFGLQDEPSGKNKKKNSPRVQLFITTDDGSDGEKGFVSDALKKLIDKGEKIDLVYAVGPGIMMEVVSNLTRTYAIKTLVSLNTVLVDGTGMCGSCRIEIGGQTKFVCVDGPEFDGHLVNFKELKARQSLFKEQEKHACKIREVN